MKILFTNNSPLIKYGIKWGFDQLGHKTFVMDGEFQLWGNDKETQNKFLIKAIEHFKPDIVFSECFAGFSEGLFHITKQKSIPHLYWAIEDVWTPSHPNKGETNWIGDYWSDYADIVFTTTIERLDYYKEKGKKSDVLLFGCNPDFHKLVPSEERFISDISLVGTNYSSRYDKTREFVLPLVKNNYDVKVYGNEWWILPDMSVNLIGYEHVYQGALPYEWMPIVYSSSKVILGMNCNDGSQTQTSMRPYEALGCGHGILVAHYTPAMELLFGGFCYLPKNTQEIFDMVNEVLSMSDEQREFFALKAQQFVYENHNYILRAQQVLESI